MSNSSKIVWGAPPPIRPKKPRKLGRTQRFVLALRARPGEWARYPKTLGSTQSISRLKERFPGTEWTSRSASGGGFHLYGRWIGETSTDPDNPDFVELP